MNSVHKKTELTINQAGDEIIRLRSEIERLREALQSILQCIDDGSGAFQLGRRAVAARAALAKDS